MDSTSDCNINPVAALLRAEIARDRAISFARFMELSLYHPEHGYYRQSIIGKSGDFFTSVSVGKLFGQLLAFWLVEELRHIPGQIDLVEAGAHDGTMARDILEWLERNEPEFAARARYTILEPNELLRARQQETLKTFPNVRWLLSVHELPMLRGAIFSNELLDAFPVHVFRWNRSRHRWREACVGFEDWKFVWTPSDQLTVSAILGLFDLKPLENFLPDQYTVECNPFAEAWWRYAAGHLEEGLLCAFDYGDEATSLWSPIRPHGTLRAFKNHKLVADVLANPGEQDITSSVNFTRIRQAGESASLVSRPLESQESFLGKIATRFYKKAPEANELRQLQTLTHPEHMGRAFKVLVQSRTSS